MFEYPEKEGRQHMSHKAIFIRERMEIVAARQK